MGALALGSVLKYISINHTGGRGCVIPSSSVLSFSFPLSEVKSMSRLSMDRHVNIELELC